MTQLVQCSSLFDVPVIGYNVCKFENIKELLICKNTIVCRNENNQLCPFILSPWLECVSSMKPIPSCERFKKVAFSTRNCGPEALRFEDNFLLHNSSVTLWQSPMYAHVQEKFPRAILNSLLRTADDGTVIFPLNFAGNTAKTFEVGSLYRVAFSLRIYQRIGEENNVSIVARLIN